MRVVVVVHKVWGLYQINLHTNWLSLVFRFKLVCSICGDLLPEILEYFRPTCRRYVPTVAQSRHTRPFHFSFSSIFVLVEVCCTATLAVDVTLLLELGCLVRSGDLD